MDEVQLFEMPMIKRRYTWFKENDTSNIILDRILMSNEWCTKWPDCKKKVLDRVVFDHYGLSFKMLYEIGEQNHLV